MRITFSLILFFLINSFASEAKCHNQSDSSKDNPEKQYTRFMILTKECKHCQDAFKITILVNDNVYMDTFAKDSLIINIPQALAGDIITIKKYKRYTLAWNCHGWTHNRKYNFKIKNKDVVQLKSISKVRSNYSRKKGPNYDM